MTVELIDATETTFNITDYESGLIPITIEQLEEFKSKRNNTSEANSELEIDFYTFTTLDGAVYTNFGTGKADGLPNLTDEDYAEYGKIYGWTFSSANPVKSTYGSWEPTHVIVTNPIIAAIVGISGLQYFRKEN